MSNNKQQTAVEWLWEIAYNRELTVEDWKQAKAMHREEQGKTWDAAMDNFKARGENYVRAYGDFDDYYNETFGGNNE
jgi:hypothetical protein